MDHVSQNVFVHKYYIITIRFSEVVSIIIHLIHFHLSLKYECIEEYYTRGCAGEIIFQLSSRLCDKTKIVLRFLIRKKKFMSFQHYLVICFMNLNAACWQKIDKWCIAGEESHYEYMLEST